MNTTRIAPLFLGISCLLSACMTEAPPSSALADLKRTTSANDAIADGQDQCLKIANDAWLPWKPEELADSAECRDANARIRRGAAFNADFAIITSCLLWNAQPDQMDAIVKKMDDFSDGKTPGQIGKSTRFFTLRTEQQLAFLRSNVPCVPKEFVEEARIALQSRAEQETALGDSHEKVEDLLMYLAPWAGIKELKARHGPGTSWAGFKTPFGKGHYDLTKEVLTNAVIPNSKNRAFSKDAVELMADASQDIDQFCWTRMLPHAQTAVVGDTVASTEQTQHDWAQFVMSYVNKAAERCKHQGPNDTRDALYQLGFVVHAVQDLTAHQGRTNEEHSYEAYVNSKDPDSTKGAYELALDTSTQFIKRALEKPLEACIPQFSNFKGGLIPYAAKETILGGPRDHTIGTHLEYVFSYRKYPALKKKNPSASIRWLTRDDALPTTCTSEPCTKFLDMIFQSKPLDPSDVRDQCFAKIEPKKLK